MEVREDPHPSRATDGVVTQVFEQRFAVNQLESRLLQRGELVAQAAAVRHPPHQPRMLALPTLPRTDVIADAAGNCLLTRFVTVQRDLNAIGGFAHQLRVADPSVKHRSPLRPGLYSSDALQGPINTINARARRVNTVFTGELIRRKRNRSGLRA